MTDSAETSVREFRIGGGWGNHISWMDFKNGSVYGHLPIDLLYVDIRFPRPGDLLKSQMESGRVGVFRFTEVEAQRDPRDMFIGKVEAVGYEDELVDDRAGDRLCEECHAPWIDPVHGMCRRCGNRTWEYTPATGGSNGTS